jgi:hypothetical protein
LVPALFPGWARPVSGGPARRRLPRLRVASVNGLGWVIRNAAARKLTYMAIGALVAVLGRLAGSW